MRLPRNKIKPHDTRWKSSGKMVLTMLRITAAVTEAGAEWAKAAAAQEGRAVSGSWWWRKVRSREGDCERLWKLKCSSVGERKPSCAASIPKDPTSIQIFVCFASSLHSCSHGLICQCTSSPAMCCLMGLESASVPGPLSATHLKSTGCIVGSTIAGGFFFPAPHILSSNGKSGFHLVYLLLQSLVPSSGNQLFAIFEACPGQGPQIGFVNHQMRNETWYFSSDPNSYWLQQKGEIKCGIEPRAFTWQYLHFCLHYTSVYDSFQLWLGMRSLHLPVTSQLGFQAVCNWSFYHRMLLLTDSNAECSCRSVCLGCVAGLAVCSSIAYIYACVCTESVFLLRFNSYRLKTQWWEVKTSEKPDCHIIITG